MTVLEYYFERKKIKIIKTVLRNEMNNILCSSSLSSYLIHNILPFYSFASNPSQWNAPNIDKTAVKIRYKCNKHYSYSVL